jgi:ABC-2 type transport system ATP-binding protein
MERTIRHNGAPVAMDWIAGGHDGGDLETARTTARVAAWFGRYLDGRKGTDTGPAFRVSRPAGTDTDGTPLYEGAEAGGYPGLGHDPEQVRLTGGTEKFANPAGGTPPAVSAVPGLGTLGGGTDAGAGGGGAVGAGPASGGTAQLSGLGIGFATDFAGQYASFQSAPLRAPLTVTGSPTVRFRVTSTSGSAVLFGKVYDVAPNGSESLPSALVAPIRVTGARHGATVTLKLPAIDHEVPAGHRLRFVLSATDLGYATPAAPATYTVALDGDALTVPTDPALATPGTGLPWWTWGLPAAGLVVAAALLLTGRRRTAAPPADPALADVPLRITGLSKRYPRSADRYAVRDLSFRVERGQVLGLLGPNGAGKTTTLRMLMGLIRPDEGDMRIFGHAVRPGAPVLSRVGSFVEGAGFLPHLTGVENLDLYWRATGRPAGDAHRAEALEIAGLGDALDRAVRTYSQGMRQRLALAQAMLGLPDLLILDEPTNGLDPPQIREMRDVMIRYARDGRTVIVSSHLLSEVEQSCTHLVVMHRGMLVQAGPVEEITGSGDTLLVTTARPVPDAVVSRVASLPGIGSAAVAEQGLLVRLDGADTAQLAAELLRLDVPLTGIGPHRRLEDVFLTLIAGGAA